MAVLGVIGWGGFLRRLSQCRGCGDDRLHVGLAMWVPAWRLNESVGSTATGLGASGNIATKIVPRVSPSGRRSVEGKSSMAFGRVIKMPTVLFR